MKFYSRNDCRFCKSKKLETIVELTPTPWCDDYRKKEDIYEPKQEVVNLDLVRCKICNNVQLKYILNHEEIYLNYTYETSSSTGLESHFLDSAKNIVNILKPNMNNIVLDIGSNDGILLNCYKKLGMKVLGIDPMPGIAKKAEIRGVNTIEDFFNKKNSSYIKENYGFPSIITSNNLVANIDNLDDFFTNVKNLMNNDTIFIIETFYLYLQIKNFVWDFTYHEHLNYFSVLPLSKYLFSIDLEIIRVESNLSKGGSMKVFIQKIGGKREVDKTVKTHLNMEREMNDTPKEFFNSYNNRIEKSKSEFIARINKLKKNKLVAGYGASATSTTLIYHYNLGNLMSYLVDDFKVKQNLFSPGYLLPVYSSDYIYKNKPDYIIILAWRYYKNIISKHKSYLKSGGKFIIPLPEFKIYTIENIEEI